MDEHQPGKFSFICCLWTEMYREHPFNTLWDLKRLSQNDAEGQGSTVTVTFLQRLPHIPEHIHESQLSKTEGILNIHPDNKNMTKKKKYD